MNQLRTDERIGDAELVRLGLKMYDEDLGRAIRADFALAETQQCLRAMVEAHRGLKTPAAPSTLQLVETFAFCSQRAAEAFTVARGTNP